MQTILAVFSLSTYCNEYSTRSIEVINPALKEQPEEGSINISTVTIS